MEVDGLILDVALPTSLPPVRGLLPALRVSRMEYLVSSNPRLSLEVPSTFTRDWLHQVLLSVLVSASDGRPPSEVLTDLTDDQLRLSMVDAAREIFGAAASDSQPVVSGAQRDSGLVSDLGDALQSSVVLSELRSAAEALWSPVDDSWFRWIQERFLVTLAAAVIDAIQAACPEVDASDLRPDIAILDSSDQRKVGRIHICEDQPGGVGIIEVLVDRYVEDPRSFWSLVASALGPGDGERIDRNLRQFLSLSGTEPLARTVERVRTAPDLRSLTFAWSELRLAMFSLGLDADQSVVGAIATRLLRPGSSRELEYLVFELLERWDDIESRFGVEVELRVFAYLAASDPSVRHRLRAVVQEQGGQPGWQISQIVGLLWPRGTRLRSAALRSYTPYAQLQPTERLLLEHLRDAPETLVSADSPAWRDDLDRALCWWGSATVRGSTELVAAAVIRDLLTEPTNVEVLEFHPRVVGVARSLAGVDLLVELREARQ